ncbi:hypothetical protein LINGRAHAP2_LOCUS4382 [Linum grandiflorum]
MVVTDKVYNFTMFKKRMANLWRLYRGIRIAELDERLILFRFYHELDLRWVLDNGPWTFESCLVSMGEIWRGQRPDRVPLNTAEFWV